VRDNIACTGNGLDALVLIFKAYIQLGKLQKDEVIVLQIPIGRILKQI
jgi:hypothetical protein